MVPTTYLGLEICSATYVVRPRGILDNWYGRAAAAAANTCQSISRVGVEQGIDPGGWQEGRWF